MIIWAIFTSYIFKETDGSTFMVTEERDRNWIRTSDLIFIPE